jgi:hypothetical protein
MIRALFLLILGFLALLLGVDAHPAATAAEWLADPKTAGDAADGLAKHTGTLGPAGWTGLITAGITVLAILRKVAPLIPGVGPAWAFVIDGAWNIAQHKDAKAADKAQAQVADYANMAKPAIKTLRDIYPDTWAKLPAEVRLPLQALEQA